MALLPALVIALAGCAEDDSRPSVLVIIIDTLRADHVGCYGSRPAATPNMDRIAEEGARFSTCVTPVPVTLPSISTILTSSYPPYHGVRDNGIFTLDLTLVTMADAFAKAGYSTAGIVGAHVVGEGTGIEQGFGHFDSDFGDEYARESSLDPARARETARAQRRAAQVTSLAADWLSGARKPFFLAAHYFDPHTPYDPPPEYAARYSQSVYLAEVAYTDSRLKGLLDAARSAAGGAGLITALVADHGEGLGEHGEDQHGFFIYDSTVLVPFLISYPGVVAPGREINAQVSTADLAPTVLDLAGLAVPGSWQGVSHAESIGRTGGGTAAEAGTPGPEGDGLGGPKGLLHEGAGACYMETFRTRYSYNWSELTGIRYDGWKLISAPEPELYDLRSDPAEEENLYASEPERARMMESLLDETSARLEGPFANLRPDTDLDDSERRKLNALGYVMPEGEPEAGPLPDPKDMVGGLNERFSATRLSEEAKALLAAGDAAGAEKKLLEALDINPRSAVALHDLGLLYWSRGDREDGVDLLEKAAELDDSSAAPHTNLGIAYMALGRYHDAVKLFEESVSFEPEDPDIRYKYGKSLEMSGAPGRALEQYYEALSRNPDLRIAKYDAAVILERTGRTAEAAELLRQLASGPAGDEIAESARALLRRMR